MTNGYAAMMMCIEGKRLSALILGYVNIIWCNSIVDAVTVLQTVTIPAHAYGTAFLRDDLVVKGFLNVAPTRALYRFVLRIELRLFLEPFCEILVFVGHIKYEDVFWMKIIFVDCLPNTHWL